MSMHRQKRHRRPLLPSPAVEASSKWHSTSLNIVSLSVCLCVCHSRHKVHSVCDCIHNGRILLYGDVWDSCMLWSCFSNLGADIELGASTPLMEAAQEGHVDIVKFLIEKGANIHAETNTMDTALTYACANGHTTIADILLQCGAELVCSMAICSSMIQPLFDRSVRQ